MSAFDTIASNESSVPPHNISLPVTGPSLDDDYEYSQETLGMLHLYDVVTVTVNNYVTVVMAAFGAVANSVAAVVIWPKTARSSTFNYMFGMAITDILYLTFIGLQWLLFTRFSIDIRLLTHCSVFYFFFAISELSACLLLLCCVERALIVYLPLKSKKWFTPYRARMWISLTTFVVLALNWHIFGGLRIAWEHVGDPDPWAVCKGATATIEKYMSKIYPWLDSAIYSFIPSLGLVIANGAIVAKFCMSRKTRSDVTQTTMSKNSRQVTIMAVSLAALYLVTTIPAVISLGLLRALDENASLYTNLKLYTIVNILSCFSYINHSCNMILYLAFSKEIRNDVARLVTCKKAMVQPYPSTSANSTK